MNTDHTQLASSRFSRFFSEISPRSSRRRSRLGLLVAAILLPLLLGVLACMPVPVGDPEKSRVDPAMSGIWLTDLDEDAPLMVLDPYDERTWLVTWFGFEEIESMESSQDDASTTDEESQVASSLELLRENKLRIEGFALFKGWLTILEGERFLTLEQKSFKPGVKPEAWYVFRVRADGEHQLQLAFLDSNFQNLSKVKTREEAEKIIRSNLEDPDLFEDPDVYNKVSDDDLEIIHNLIEAFE